jgi:hypothetical protein
MNRTALAGLPTQNKALEIVTLVDQISSISILRKVNVRCDFGAVNLQLGDKSAQIRQLHLLGRVLQLLNRGQKVHISSTLAGPREDFSSEINREQMLSAWCL